MDEQNNQNSSQGQAQDQSQNNNGASYTKAPSGVNVMAVLAYIGPLVILSFIMGKDDPFVKFHAKQGLVIFVIEIAIWLLSSMLYSLWMILNVLNLATLVLSIIGIINVVQAKQKELPFVGQFAKHFNF